MVSVFLSDSILGILRAAARGARIRQDAVRIDDLLAALLDDAAGRHLRSAIADPATWPAVERHAEAQSLRGYLDRSVVRFDRPAERLLALGARQVLLGPYEARHLAQAVAEESRTTSDPFARFEIDLPAWRRLSANP